MNPRFKFRVWDIEDCTYFEPRDFDDLWLNENAELRVGFYSDATQMIEDYTDNVIIEQCTGLKDKNGNLIYEGDIIHDLGEIEPVCSLPLVVRWSDRTAGFYLDHQKIGMRAYLGRLDSADSHNYEIIGNIHEQAEQKDK